MTTWLGAEFGGHLEGDGQHGQREIGQVHAESDEPEERNAGAWLPVEQIDNRTHMSIGIEDPKPIADMIRAFLLAPPVH